MSKLISLFLSLAIIVFFSNCENRRDKSSNSLQPISYTDIRISGELNTRITKNFDRMEEDNYYPENVFPVKHHSTSEEWPGDKEGRTILALVLEAQATHRTPKYLEQMIQIIPTKVNEKGYLGKVQGDTINEQQLSGHGWFLRGLCEYYIWKKDHQVKKYIQDIIQNLALPTRGYYKNYPINPVERIADVGAMAGSNQNVISNWLLSSDIGCAFIFMDGIIQAYGLFPSPELKDLIDEMVSRFLEIDLVAIKAQTHATLTGCRGLVRYFEITGNKDLLAEAVQRYALYRQLAMTENYENFNWFGRPEWTEPCAIVDSYILAMQLWQYTSNASYLEDAHHIYYNALSHTQRANGGFGCDNCPGPEAFGLKILVEEAYWCCTMRGGEGLSKAVQYTYFTKDNSIYIPFYNNSVASFALSKGNVQIKQTTAYPFAGKVSFLVTSKNHPEDLLLHLFAPEWAKNPKIIVNGKAIEVTFSNGFLSFPLVVQGEVNIEFSFEMKQTIRDAINMPNTCKGSQAIEYGPLLLGYSGEKEITFSKEPQIDRINEKEWKVSDGNNSYVFTPIYHLLDKQVNEKDYKKQIIFITEK